MFGRSFSIGMIFFSTLACMSIGAVMNGYVAIFGLQSFRDEFNELIEHEMPHVLTVTQLNSQISELTSHIGLVLAARSNIEVDTIRIQANDQINAIERTKNRLADFANARDEQLEVSQTLTALLANLTLILDQSYERLLLLSLYDQTLLEVLDEQSAPLAELQQRKIIDRIYSMSRFTSADQIRNDIEALYISNTQKNLLSNLLEIRKKIVATNNTLQGSVHQHTTLSSRLLDATRFLSSSSNIESQQSGQRIQNMLTRNLIFVLGSFLVFICIAAFIYHILDREIIAKIQNLTHKMNSQEVIAEDTELERNEISQLEKTFANLLEAISERQAKLLILNKEAAQAQQNAEIANKSKSMLLAAASHDLRQPIHAMGLLLGTIDKEKLSPENQKTLKQFNELIRESIRLFHSILDLSKLEAGNFVTQVSSSSLQKLFHRIQRDFQTRAEINATKLDINFPPSDIILSSDADALYRILSNLTVNAIEHANHSPVHISYELLGKECRICVADNGPGLHSTLKHKTDHSGYGLGLNISFALAKELKIPLSFDLPEMGGTHFTMIVPIMAEPAIADIKQREDKLIVAKLRKPTVLLLENNTEIQASTAKLMRDKEFPVTAISSVDNAITAFDASQAYDVIVSDYDLGRGHLSEEFIEHVLAQHIQVPIIITTASKARLPEAWTHIEHLFVLEKPFTPLQLFSTVNYVQKIHRR